jgi:hypothetical protein
MIITINQKRNRIFATLFRDGNIMSNLLIKRKLSINN